MPRADRTSRSIAATVFALAAATAWIASGRGAEAAAPPPTYPQVVPVAKTSDNRPFSYRIESAAEKAGYVLYRLTYPSPVQTALPQNNTVPAEYYVPKGMRPEDPKRPAVISMHILDGNMELVRMTCTVLASRGIPAILFKLPYYGERGPREGPRALAADPKLFVDALTQGMEDVRRTIDVLASRPEIDPERIGITGISLGGIVAATAAEREPRLSRAMLVLAGGDLLTIIHHARETEDLSRLIRGLPADQRARLEEAIRSVDPLQRAAALRPRAERGKVLMVNAADDELIPRACTEKLAAALGISRRVEWLEGLGHYTAMAALPAVLERMVGFFGEDLPPGLRVQPPPPSARTPVQVVLSLVKEATDLLLAEPSPGRCHLADLTVTVQLDGDQGYEGRLLLVRGWQGRFKLQCRLPVVGEVALGQGSYPWIVSAKKTVFKGVKNAPAAPGDPLAFVDPEHLLRIRMIAGVVAGAALAPDILEPLVAVAEEPAADGRRTIRLTLKGRNRGTLTLALQGDGKTPSVLTFALPGARGKIVFRGWQQNTPAHEAAFDPPPGLPAREVEANTLVRMFSAMFNFAMENAE